MIIKLDDGRYVRSVECQYAFVRRKSVKHVSDDDMRTAVALEIINDFLRDNLLPALCSIPIHAIDQLEESLAGSDCDYSVEHTDRRTALVKVFRKKT